MVPFASVVSLNFVRRRNFFRPQLKFISSADEIFFIYGRGSGRQCRENYGNRRETYRRLCAFLLVNLRKSCRQSTTIIWLLCRRPRRMGENALKK